MRVSKPRKPISSWMSRLSTTLNLAGLVRLADRAARVGFGIGFLQALAARRPKRRPTPSRVRVACADDTLVSAMVEDTEEYKPPPPATGDRVITERSFVVAFQQLAGFEPYALAVPDHAFGRTHLAAAAHAAGRQGLEDQTVSREHFRVERTNGGHVDIVCLSSRGMRVNGWKVTNGERAKLLGGEVIRIGGTLLVYLRDLPVSRAEDFRPDPAIVTTDGEIVGPYALRAVRRALAGFKQAQPRVVLVRGETGTGKERLVHGIASALNAKCVVARNVTMFPKDLIASELFGSRAGAFTGAVDRDGAVQEARKRGGALFLDEIGDLPLDAQAGLLRFLDKKAEVQVLGARGDGPASQSVPVPVLMATNKDLAALVAQQSFRADLLARVQAQIELPPLRARSCDVFSIFRQIWESVVRPPVETDRISADAVETLLLAWHDDNVRGLDQLAFEAAKVSVRRLVLDDTMVKSVVKSRGGVWWRAALCPAAIEEASKKAPAKRGAQAGMVAAAAWLNDRAVGEPIAEGTFKRFASPGTG